MATARKRTVEIEIVADDKQAQRSLQNIDKSVTKTGKVMSDFAKITAIAFGAKQVADFARQAIDAASELEQAVGGTQAVFGSARGVIEDFATDSAEAIGLSEAAFRTATTGIGGQLKRMTGDVEFAAEQSIFLTQVAADLAATYGGTTQEAVQALGAAFRGEADPAERFNLNLKASVVNAKAVELGLAASTTQVSENAKAQAILALVTQQSADAQGQFAREADTAAGKLQRLEAASEDAAAEMGEVLLPIWAGMLDTGSDMVTVLGFLAGELDGAASASDDMGSNVAFALTPLSLMVDAAHMAAEAVEDLKEQKRQAALAAIPLKDELRDADQVLRSKYNPAFNEGTQRIEDFAKANREAEKAVDDLRDAIEELASEQVQAALDEIARRGAAFRGGPGSIGLGAGGSDLAGSVTNIYQNTSSPEQIRAAEELARRNS